MSLIFEKSRKGRIGYSLPDNDVKSDKIEKIIDSRFLRKSTLDLPEVSEPQVVRHYTNLSSKNHHIDKGFYPLGSCTMKYNPKINEYIANKIFFLNLHPNQDESCTQSVLKIIYELQEMLLEITGMDNITLQPAAGSQGEFVGLLLMRKYHELKGRNPSYIIIPETAHGTNPASVILAGYKIKQIGTNHRGRVDVQELESLVDENVAGFMLTQPNTLGLFEDEIERISKIIHKVDGLMYMDGANLNAMVGLARPGDMGFDITHLNLHKTFSTPHGGGGPGAGPIAVKKHLADFLPVPHLEKNKLKKYFWNYNKNHSIGKVHPYYGNFGILIRAYSYLKMLGLEGLEKMSKHAIINANYLKACLSGHYDVPYSNGIMHEFVMSCKEQKDRGASTLEIAKNLLDYNVHPPTIYFPINIPEAMMIEPTESETKDTLDYFISAMLEINKKIDLDLEYIKNAPHTTPVQKLNEVQANRELNIKWKKSE